MRISACFGVALETMSEALGVRGCSRRGSVATRVYHVGAILTLVAPTFVATA